MREFLRLVLDSNKVVAGVKEPNAHHALFVYRTPKLRTALPSLGDKVSSR